METNENKGGLPAQGKPETVTEDTTSPMTVSEFAALLQKKAVPETPEAEVPVEAVEEAKPEAGEADTPVTPEKTEAEEPKGEEQPEANAEEEDAAVLSQLKPDTVDKFKKRIDSVTRARKEAEEKAAALEAKVKELEAKAAQPPPPAPEPEVIAVPMGDDKNDLTAKAKSESDLEKLESDARSVLETYEENEDLITRAIAREEDTVTIGGQEMRVADLRHMKKVADKHLKDLIPARRRFMRERQQVVGVAKAKFPQLFDSRAQEYQELQAVVKQYPQLRSVPSLELMVGYALVGMGVERKQQEEAARAKASPAKPASATPPKSAADSKETTAQAKPKVTGASDRNKLKSDLEKAEKELDRTGSKEAYQKMLILQEKLRKFV